MYIVQSPVPLGIDTNRLPSDVIYRGENKYIDYYEFTFDHLVPSDDEDPEVMVITIYETEYDGAAFAQRYCPVTIDPSEYVPHQMRVLACPYLYSSDCHRTSVNNDVKRRETDRREQKGHFVPFSDAFRARGIGEEWHPQELKTRAREGKQWG